MWDINLGNVEYIDDSAFEDCENIRKIKIDSEEMESIEELSASVIVLQI